jgi:hypothetical protein
VARARMKVVPELHVLRRRTACTREGRARTPTRHVVEIM